MSTEEGVSQLEQSFKILVELARRADERMDDHLAWINQLGAAQAELAAAQANADTKIAALADAQIRAEDEMAESRREMAEFRHEMAEFRRVTARLSGRQTETDARLDRLAELVERYVGGRGDDGARG